jgi:hypothetical protein
VIDGLTGRMGVSSPKYKTLAVPGETYYGGSISGDPVIEIGGKVLLEKPVPLFAKGDIEGFGVALDPNWQVQGKYDYTLGGYTNETISTVPSSRSA